MDQDLERILEAIRDGRMDVAQAAREIRGWRIVELGFATLDAGRADRCGFPEVVFGQGKSDEEAIAVAREIAARERRLLVTRARREVFEALRRDHPGTRYDERARMIMLRLDPAPEPRGRVLVLSAGTADAAVAREAELTIEMMDARVETARDVGVAGIQRVLRQSPRIARANAVVVVAGMDGALPSVVAGLCDRPVIAVPTSVGYGASYGGLAALLTMLNACAPGVTVVNIDNGFGAGYAAALVNRLATESDPAEGPARGGDTGLGPPGAEAAPVP